jgi:hypothetical protein
VATRLIAENHRLESAIAAQKATCEAQEKRLQAEEAIIRDCKQFLHDLPPNVHLRVVEGYAGDLGAIRAHIRETMDEIAQVGRMPVPSDDLGDRIARHVAKLAAKAQPVVRGISDGQDLSVQWPLHDRADRIAMSGFSDSDANALLLLAFMDGETLAARLVQVAHEGSISSGERDQRLQALQQQLTRLRYDEEQAVTAAINDGGDVSRDAPPWAVLMVEIEHRQQAAA